MARSLKDLLKDIVFMPDGTPIPKSAFENMQKQTTAGTAKQTAKETQDILKGYARTPDGTPIPKSALENMQKQTTAGTAKQTGKDTQEKPKNTASASSRTPIRQNGMLAPVLPEGYAYTPDNTPVPESALNNPGVLETFNTSIAKQQEKLKDYTVTSESVRIPKDFKPASVLPEGYTYTPDNTPVPEWALNKGQGDVGSAQRQYAIDRYIEQGEHREMFQANIKAAGLDRRTERDALRTYDQLTQGGAGSKRAAVQLQAEILRAAAQKSEISADLTVKKTEGIIRLRPLYTAVQQAAEAGNRAAFENAKEQYAYAYALEQAKHQAAKAKVQSSFNAVDDGVKRALAGVQGQFAVSAGGVNSGILDHTSGASPYGKINGAGDVAQERFGVSAGGILDHTSGASPYGKINGTGDVAQERFGAPAGGILDHTSGASPYGKIDGTGDVAQERFGAPAGGILDHTSGASPYGKIDRPVDATWDDSRLNKLQAFLDAVGMIPGFGEAADGLNALISLMRGNYVDAGLSVASMIPFFGWGATAGKAGKYALEGAGVLGTVAKYGDEAIDAGQAVVKHSGEIANTGEAILKSTDDLVGGVGRVAEDFVEGAGEVTDELIEGTGESLKRDELLNSVQNDKLRNAVDQIYRPNASVGDGGLGDAVRHEISTGELVGGKSHLTKAKERIKNLENILNTQNLNPSDKKIINELINDLMGALGGS